MSEAPSLLCPIDFSPLSEKALRLAIEMCRRTRSRLVLEHNLESPPPTGLAVGWMWTGEHESHGQDMSKEAIARLEQTFHLIPEGVEYEAKITRGPLDEGILHLAKSLPAEMIVMGTHGPSTAQHKSLTEGIIMKAPCSVLTIGESYRPETVFGVEGGAAPERLSILVPFDFGARSRVALRYGLAMARRMPHRVHLVHVVEPAQQLHVGPAPPVETAEIEARLNELIPRDLEDRVDAVVLTGNAAQRILEEAERTEALFILMAAHGKSAFKRFLFGTRTIAILQGSDCPVWFLPPAVQRGYS